MLSNERGNSLVVLSGGQDSATILVEALRSSDEVTAVTFDYGQRHRVEIDAARNIVEVCRRSTRRGLLHEVISLGDSILRSTSPLVDYREKVEKYSDYKSLPGGIEKTFVPMRNLLFLTIAANRAIAYDCSRIYIGVSQEDFGGYPDCRATFLEDAGNALRSSVGVGTDRLRIVAPLLNRTKRETVELAYNYGDLGRDVLAHSHTCYEGSVPPCGKCHSCLLRAKGFFEAGLPDPAIIRMVSEGLLPEDYPRNGLVEESEDA